MDPLNIPAMLEGTLRQELDAINALNQLKNDTTFFDSDALKMARLSHNPEEKANALFTEGYRLLLDKNDNGAIELLIQAAELGHAYAMAFLGDIYKAQNEIGIAIHFYQEAIALRNPMAMISMSELLQNLPHDHEAQAQFNLDPDKVTIDLYQQLIDLGYPMGWLGLATFYQKEGPYQNLQKAIKLLKHKHLHNNPDALFQLSNIYSKGIGCKPNQKKSYAYFEHALALKEGKSDMDALLSDATYMDAYTQWKNSHSEDSIELWIKSDNTQCAKLIQQTAVLSDRALCDLALQSIYGTIENNAYQVDYNLAYIYFEIANMNKKGYSRPEDERIYPNNDASFLEKLSVLQKIQFDKHLNAIKKKILELFDESKKSSDYREPTKTALALHQALIKATKVFMETPLTEESKQILHGECSKAITEAKPILEKHPGWRNPIAILLDTFVFVLTAGTAPFVHWLIRRRSNLFSPSSLIKLEEAEEALALMSSVQRSEKKGYLNNGTL